MRGSVAQLRKRLNEDVSRNFASEGVLVAIGFNGNRAFEWCAGQNADFDSWEQSQISEIAEQFSIVIADLSDNSGLARFKF